MALGRTREQILAMVEDMVLTRRYIIIATEELSEIGFCRQFIVGLQQ